MLSNSGYSNSYGEFYKSLREVSFEAFLRYNDNMLINYSLSDCVIQDIKNANEANVLFRSLKYVQS